jgi:hypothetical protein
MRGKSNLIKRNIEKVWGAGYTIGARYLLKYTVTSKWAIKKLSNLPDFFNPSPI